MKKDSNQFFIEFYQDWQEKFDKIPAILNHLSGCTALKEKFCDNNFIKAEDLVKTQTEWLKLMTQLNHPEDVLFFKPYWIPVIENSFDWFIDLSTDTFSLFVAQYTLSSGWEYKILLRDITELLLKLENTIFEDEIIDDGAAPF